jgi:hypothetical protein
MKVLLATLLCSVALLMPYRARMVFCEALGWVFQAAYYVMFRMSRFILRSLEK